jgi:hypothetical protein
MGFELVAQLEGFPPRFDPTRVAYALSMVLISQLGQEPFGS